MENVVVSNVNIPNVKSVFAKTSFGAQTLIQAWCSAFLLQFIRQGTDFKEKFKTF